MKLRNATQADTEQIIQHIASVYSEIGEKLCLEGADKDLTNIYDYYYNIGGDFILLVDGNHLIGTHAVMPVDVEKKIMTFRRLYLKSNYRGSLLGKKLMHWAVNRAKSKNYSRVEFWSDARFSHAHQFFKHYGFKKGGIRTMHDSYIPYKEYQFSMDL